jgi:hypothetical protein
MAPLPPMTMMPPLSFLLLTMTMMPPLSLLLLTMLLLLLLLARVLLRAWTL